MTPSTVAAPDRGLAALVERHFPDLRLSDDVLKSALPAIARSPAESARVTAAVQEVRSDHRIVRGDARDLSGLDDRSVHLVVTSPPYWTLKEYNEGDGQLGAIGDYERFVAELATGSGRSATGCWSQEAGWSSWWATCVCQGAVTAATP